MLAPDLREKLRHNTAVNIADGSLFGFGIMGLASYVTIVPLFLSYLTESTALIGFVATLFYMGWQGAAALRLQLCRGGCAVTNP